MEHHAVLHTLEKLKQECGDVKPTKVIPAMRIGDWLDFWYQNHSKPGLRQTSQLAYEGWIYSHAIPVWLTSH